MFSGTGLQLGGSGSGGSVATVTKRVTMPIGSDNTGTLATPDWAERKLVAVPVTTTRWRLRIRNMSGNNPGTAITGAQNFTGVWMGTPSYPATGAAAWAGVFASAPTQVLSSFSTAANGDEYTSSWVTTAGSQFAANVPVGLSWGVTNAGTINVSKGSQGALIYWSFVAGNGGAATADATAIPTSQFAGDINSLLDVRIEYEFSTPSGAGGTPVVLCLGDSITAGYVGGSEPVGFAGTWPHETWPGVAGLRNGFAYMNAGIGGAAWTTFDDVTKWSFARMDLATTVPDYAIIAIGSNAVSSLASTEDALTTLVGILRSTLGITRIMIATIIPREFTGSQEAVRVSINNYFAGCPNGILACFDFDKALGVIAPEKFGTATWNPASVASGAATSTTVTVTGAALGDLADAAFSLAVPAGVVLSAEVTAADTVTVTLLNLSGGAVDLASGTLMATATTPIGSADSDYIATYPHPQKRGYQKMAAEVTLAKL